MLRKLHYNASNLHPSDSVGVFNASSCKYDHKFFFLKGIFESHGQNKYITLLVFSAVFLAMIPLAGSVKGVKSSWNGVRSVINTSGPELSHEL